MPFSCPQPLVEAQFNVRTNINYKEIIFWVWSRICTELVIWNVFLYRPIWTWCKNKELLLSPLCIYLIRACYGYQNITTCAWNRSNFFGWTIRRSRENCNAWWYFLTQGILVNFFKLHKRLPWRLCAFYIWLIFFSTIDIYPCTCYIVIK